MEKAKKSTLKDPFKLVLLKEETLEEVRAYRLTPLNAYILVSTILLITGVLMVSAIFFTPLRRLVPGYGDVHTNPEFIALSNRIGEIQQQMEDQQLYIERFRRIAMGNSMVEGTVPQLPEFAREVSSPVPDTALLEDIVVVTQDSAIERSFEPVSVGYLFYVSPLSGPISQPFLPQEEHYGVDVLAPQSTPVKAILDGYVITADWTLQTGNTIGIQHGNGMVSFYKHNARNLKRLGQYVRAGEAVAIVGNTGELTTGPHLHFELWIDGLPVNPLDYVDF